MRKFRNSVISDPKTFEPILHLSMTENGVGELLFSGPMAKTRYTAEQQARINTMNKVLFDRELPLMSQEEADFFVGIHPSQIDKDPTEAELQALAGFKVEKIVTPTETASEGATLFVGKLFLEPNPEA